jgi:hypothetical protein
MVEQELEQEREKYMAKKKKQKFTVKKEKGTFDISKDHENYEDDLDMIESIHDTVEEHNPELSAIYKRFLNGSDKKAD